MDSRRNRGFSVSTSHRATEPQSHRATEPQSQASQKTRARTRESRVRAINHTYTHAISVDSRRNRGFLVPRFLGFYEPPSQTLRKTQAVGGDLSPPPQPQPHPHRRNQPTQRKNTHPLTSLPHNNLTICVSDTRDSFSAGKCVTHCRYRYSFGWADGQADGRADRWADGRADRWAATVDEDFAGHEVADSVEAPVQRKRSGFRWRNPRRLYSCPPA